MEVLVCRFRWAARRGAAVAILLVMSCPSFVLAQLEDCDDVDHDCTADRYVSRALKKAGRHLIRCVDQGVTPCDLTEDLEKIISPDCRFAVECGLRDLFFMVGDGSTDCVQQLFKEGYKFMAKKTTRIDREQLDKLPEDLVKCQERGGKRCDDPIAPPLTDACTGETTPLDGATCICGEADRISNNFLLTPATCVAPAAPAAAAVQQSRQSEIAAAAGGLGNPNIILILSDDQRWDTIGLDHPKPGPIPTPVMPHVINELAKSGVTFTNGFVTTALCCPSRTAILSGQYNHRNGIFKNNPPNGGAGEFDDTSTIATWLQADGYRTGFVGKYLNGYATLSPCIPPGWDEWHTFVQVKFYDYDFNDNGVITHFGTAPQDYSQTVLTQRALQFIENAVNDGRPFFLHFSPKAPHGPATPRSDHIGLWAGIPNWRPPNYAIAPVNGPTWVQNETWTTNEMNNTDQFRIDQLESLQAVDEGVRDIMQKLRDLNEDDNTLVVYTGDNGFSWGSHKWRAKQCPYQECMHVPMIMRYEPLGTTERVDTRPVLNIDFAPTFVELAGATVPGTHVVNGQSVVPLLMGGPATWRTEFLNEHWAGGGGSGIPDFAQVQDATHKYTEYYNLVPIETELYDLTIDPYELNNVTNDPGYAGVKAALKARLDDLRDD